MVTRMREWTEEFIEIYRSEPCLWKIKRIGYRDRGKKDVTYAICEIDSKLREIKPDANRENSFDKSVCEYSLVFSNHCLFTPRVTFFTFIIFYYIHKTENRESVIRHLSTPCCAILSSNVRI